MPVITVRGKIKKDDLGITLMHEHLFIDLKKAARNSGANENAKMKMNLRNLHLVKRNVHKFEDNLILSNLRTINSELLEYKKMNGKTIVELTTDSIGRSPLKLRKISENLDLNIIMGTGLYAKYFLPKNILSQNSKILIKELIKEIQYGVTKFCIKPGIIGEIGADNIMEDWGIKVIKIISKVQKETGLPISFHTTNVPASWSNHLEKEPALPVLRLLKEEKIDMEKVIISHVDAKISRGYLKKILDIGCYIEFDHFGRDYSYGNLNFKLSSDLERIDNILHFINAGYIEQILISQDVCMKVHLNAYGGNGYAHILKNIIPIMLKKGITKEDINTILCKNPKNILDIDDKYF